jgi:hypothetical protein
VDRISLMHPAAPHAAPCPDCEGSGWTCLTCERNGAHCTCPLDAQDAMDCQTCQGTGEADDTGATDERSDLRPQEH